MAFKEYTRDIHKVAESTAFSQKLVNGTLSEKEYANYLYNFSFIYDQIEKVAKKIGMFDELPGLERHDKIVCDIMDTGYTDFKVCDSALVYANYLGWLGSREQQQPLIKAHVYCRHMGDLFGGQIIKKRIPCTKGTFYEFENPAELRIKIREVLERESSALLLAEALVAFRFNIMIMEELDE